MEVQRLLHSEEIKLWVASYTSSLEIEKSGFLKKVNKYLVVIYS